MIGNYFRLPEDELNQALANPASITEVLYPSAKADLAGGHHLDIDKSWHLIHFLLTGELWGGKPPLCNVVLGGKPIGDVDVGYGPARYLTPAQVDEVHVALSSMTPDDLWARGDRKAMQNPEIYPGWTGNEEDREYVTTNFAMVKSFFEDAAEDHDAVILYIN